VESHFLAYLYRLRHIERWSLMRNTTRENVAEHSYHVACSRICCAKSATASSASG